MERICYKCNRCEKDDLIYYNSYIEKLLCKRCDGMSEVNEIKEKEDNREFCRYCNIDVESKYHFTDDGDCKVKLGYLDNRVKCERCGGFVIPNAIHICRREDVSKKQEDIINKPKCKRCKKENFECKESNQFCQECWDYMGEYVSKVKNKTEDVINKPKHYHEGVQPIEAIETNFEELETRGFLKGNVLKYVMRSNKKGKELEDLKKARWNLNKLIERLEGVKVNPLSKERNR